MQCMRNYAYNGVVHLRNKIVLALSALTILLVLSSTTGSASAATYVPGVKAGNTATFSVVGNPALPYNRTDITVYGTNGAYVQLTAVNYKPDGSLYSVESHNWTVESYGSSSYLDAVFFWVVSANLTNGDTVLTDAAFGCTVYSNMTMTAAGASRFVMYANGSGIFVNPFLMWFDRATGLIVKGDYATMGGWINTTLVSTNAWSPPTTTTVPSGLPLTTLEIAEAAVIVVLLLVLVLVMRRGK